MPQPIERLLFVYAANSGLFAALADSTRKVLRLKGCSLCSITHGLAGEKSEWTSCRQALGVEVDYLHADEVTQDVRDVAGDQLPCVLAQTASGMQMLLGPDVLARCRGSVPDLRGRLKNHAARRGLVLPGLDEDSSSGFAAASVS